ncbi:MAG: ABC transporter permease [Desulfobacterales bacterium]|jgi:octopine/nopaline transport system permease protein
MNLLGFGATGWGDEMARAALMTLAVSVCAFALALVIGALGAAGKLSRHKPLRILLDIYTTMGRGIPELLIIYLLFFGGSGAVMYLARLFGYHGYIEVNAFTAGVAAIALINGAYQTEVFRGAVLAIPKGQIEAGLSLGMSDRLLFQRVLIPQVLRLALPGLGNCWLSALKETALVSVTGLVEIMRQAYVASGSTQKPFIFYSVAAGLFLLLTSVSSFGFRRAEQWTGRGVRRA